RFMAVNRLYPAVVHGCHVDDNVRRIGEQLRDRVVKEVGDGVLREVLQSLQTAVPGEARGVANRSGQGDVIGMLILAPIGRQYDDGLEHTYLAGQEQARSRRVLDAAIAAEIQKIDGGSENIGRSPGFAFALFRGACASGLTSGGDQNPDMVPP